MTDKCVICELQLRNGRKNKDTGAANHGKPKAMVSSPW
jgi:hypothetical protein